MKANEQKQTAAQRRRAALVAKLAAIRHWLFGALAVQPVPGTVFDPRAFFLDPARLEHCLTYWRSRARRDGCGAGLSARLRESALDQAAQACLSHFMDADYRRLGITADEFARAVLLAYKRCRRAFWNDAQGDRDAARQRRAVRKGWRPFNRAQASRTPDPARIVHAADALGMDPGTVTGEGICDEIPGGLVTIPGGPSGRGETDGKMVNVTLRERVRFIPGGAFCRERVGLVDIETGWRMVRGRGWAQTLPPCTVREGIAAPRPVFRPAPVPQEGQPRPEGIVNARPMVALIQPSIVDAVHGMRRLGKSLPRGSDARRRIAANLRLARAV